MGSLFTAKDGRLKTGRITIIVFLAIILFSALLFKAAKPIDYAVVTVKHIFEPRPKEVTQKEQKRNKKETVAIVTPVEPKPQADAEQKATSVTTPKIDAIVDQKKDVLTMPDSKQLAPKQIDEAARKSEQNETIGSKNETKIAEEEQQQKNTEEVALVVKDHAYLQEHESGTINLDISKDINKLIGEKGRIKTNNSMDTKTMSPTVKQSMDVDAERSMVTVGKRQYVDLFKEWRQVGKGGEIDDEINKKVSLRVENLRQVYSLFQMKPVVKINGIFIDLENSSRIPEKALNQYSNTVFLVDDPWVKWGKKLKDAGVKRSDHIDVRYYMYAFVKDAIYARAQAAFEWAKQQGVLDDNSTPNNAEILGRSFVIHQEGGGRFGVYVPFMLTRKDGSTAKISPACFKGEKDIETLVIAGLL